MKDGAGAYVSKRVWEARMPENRVGELGGFTVQERLSSAPFSPNLNPTVRYSPSVVPPAPEEDLHWT